MNAENRNLSKSVLRKLRLDKRKMEAFFKSLGVLRLDRITPEHCQMYQSSWKYSPSTARMKLGYLKQFFDYCVAMGWLEENPAKRLKAPIVPENDVLPFEEDEVERILEAARNYAKNHPNNTVPEFPERLLALVLVLRYTGFGIADAVALRRSDFVNGSSIVTRRQKTNRPVSIWIPEELSVALQAFQPCSDEYFFISGESELETCKGNYRRSLTRLFKDAEVENASPHRFRHTFAVELLNKGTDIYDVSVLLGHSSVKTTERHYAKWVRSRQQRLDGIVRRLWKKR